MGTNPGVGKMPNRELGREIGKDETNEATNEPRSSDETRRQNENSQEIVYDPSTDNKPGGGTNFQHQSKKTRKTSSQDQQSA